MLERQHETPSSPPYWDKIMRRILQLISWISLAATIVPAILYSNDKIPLDVLKTIMLAATICWFISTSLWMGRKDSSKPEEKQGFQT